MHERTRRLWHARRALRPCTGALTLHQAILSVSRHAPRLGRWLFSAFLLQIVSIHGDHNFITIALQTSLNDSHVWRPLKAALACNQGQVHVAVSTLLRKYNSKEDKGMITSITTTGEFRSQDEVIPHPWLFLCREDS